VSLFLTHEEIVELTGSPQRPRQCEWLRANGYIFDIGLDGRPKLARAAVLARQVPGYTANDDDQPNFDALDAA